MAWPSGGSQLRFSKRPVHYRDCNVVQRDPGDFEKTQKYLQSEYGDMPAPTKTGEFVLSSTYKQGRFCIMHVLWPNKNETGYFVSDEVTRTLRKSENSCSSLRFRSDTAQYSISARF